MGTSIWGYTKNGKKGKVQLVNDLYRWQVWELWLDRDGKQTHEGKLLATDSEQTLQAAKAKALTVLER